LVNYKLVLMGAQEGRWDKGAFEPADYYVYIFLCNEKTVITYA
jgi:hypothetical protein